MAAGIEAGEDRAIVRKRMSGRRIAIVHTGEDVPMDEGYRPIRYGQLATWMTAAGAEVVRVAPTFSHLRRYQRPAELSGTMTEEGRIELIDTTAYAANRSADRFRFIADFVKGAGPVLASLDPVDLVLVGYPPPGLIRAVRRAVGGDTPIVADIRDLWPDAQLPSGRPGLQRVGRLVGRALAQEMRLADGVVAMSPLNLQRAPRDRRIEPVPLSISPALVATPAVAIDGPMQAVFAGSLSPMFDFDALFEGWSRFVATRPDGDPGADRSVSPRLVILGDGPLRDHIETIAGDLPGVELVGHVSPAEVPGRLSAADVGLVPLRPGTGTCLTNKVLEYVGTGAYVLHTLEPEVGDELGDLGDGIAPTGSGWAAGFLRAESRLAALRADRAARRADAIGRFSQGAVEPRWFDIFDRIIGDD